ncbi:helix-turn-helix transcriptional regulator [Arthrobacter castelli]|uniref:helix-turn-helix transcriptional regulator n=1 Tax=Arthrobacter castelli TaxID=271431 RepID=UPI003CCC206B
MVGAGCSQPLPSRKPPSQRAGETHMPRFLTLTDVGEILNISSAQTYALVRSGELPAIQIGGRGYLKSEGVSEGLLCL